jgi:hypothetical protein
MNESAEKKEREEESIEEKRHNYLLVYKVSITL